MKPRPVPSYDKIHQMVSNVFDQLPTADIFESLRNNKFLPSKNLGDNLKQTWSYSNGIAIRNRRTITELGTG